MKRIIICLLLLVGTFSAIHAQDKVVLRNGRTIEVYVRRSLNDRIEYTYPSETSVYERPKSAVSYIQYEDGRKEICDESLRSAGTTNKNYSTKTNKSSKNSTSKSSQYQSGYQYWQNVKTTFTDSDVNEMTRLKRLSAISNTSYKDAVIQLKKKVAAIGGTAVLIMDEPENESGEDIEVMGIAYRDENVEYVPQTTQRNAVPQESSSNIRRRRIAQQMESYNNETDLEFQNNNTSANSRSNNTQQPTQRTYDNAASPDAIYLLSGRVIRGTIEELEPDDFVSIRTAAGKVYEYSMDDVKRVSRGSTKHKTTSSNSSRSNNYNNQPSKNNYDDNDYDNGYNNKNYKDYNNYSVSGYKGTFDVGYTFAMGGTGEKGRFEISTSHGYQINEYLFVGAGIGLNMYSARDSKLKNPNNYPHYIGLNPSSTETSTAPMKDSLDYVYQHAIDSSYTTLPIFLDVRGYLPLENSSIIPFAMLRLGYAFNLSDGFGGMGMYMNPAVGIKYQITPMIGINFSVGYSYQSYGGIPKEGGYGYYYKKSDGQTYEAKGAGGISLKLGVEF